ncbi:MAG: TetR/AcrR family transcriptional regulator [Pseudomonadota bacterium]
MPTPGHRLFRTQSTALGKRERTRSALLDSAIGVFATKGFEASRITDITDHAGLANGTFYNYYRDKREILRDVALGLAVEIVRQINDEMGGIDRAVARVVTATSRLMQTARQEPEWIEVLLSSIPIVPDLRAAVTQYLREDLKMGVDQGDFDITIDLLLINQILSLVRTAVMLDRDVKDETVRRTCEACLRLLGVTPARAARQVNRILNRRHQPPIGDN